MVVMPILGEGWQHILDLLDSNIVRSETGKPDLEIKDFIDVHCGTMILYYESSKNFII